MTLLRPIYMQPAVGDAEIDYPASEFRQIPQALVGGDGVFGGHSLKIVQRGAGANMSIDANSGQLAVTGDDTANQGMYLLTNTADGYNVTVPAAPGAGTRVHRVVAQVRDKRANGAWTTYDWDVLVLADTGSGTPALPASALNLATVSVSAGQASVTNANITDLRVFLAQLGFQQGWQNFSLLASWTNRGTGYYRAAYRARYLGSGAIDVDVIGNIAGGTAADGTTIATLPAGYVPNVNQHIWVTTSGRFAANDTPHIFVSNTGVLQLFNCTGANWISFNGTIHLDAPGG